MIGPFCVTLPTSQLFTEDTLLSLLVCFSRLPDLTGQLPVYPLRCLLT